MSEEARLVDISKSSAGDAVVTVVEAAISSSPGELAHLDSWFRPAPAFLISILIILWSFLMCAPGWTFRSLVLKMQSAQPSKAPRMHQSCQADSNTLQHFPIEGVVYCTQNGKCYHSAGCHTLKGELRMYKPCTWCVERAKTVQAKKVL